ncbi:MAG: ABC transporter permease [Candidatus Didemnitutus sp.]|nr:ABC transporter permease [Candidatus Didemnitutus sp.]
MPHVIRFALRSLRKSPGFTAATILTLALGIGATTAIFSVLYAVLLKPFPYPHAEQLVVLWQKGPQMEMSISWPTVQDWMNEQQTFSALAVHRRDRFNLSGAGQLPENVTGAYASASLFDVAQLPPVAGRYFTRDEDKPGAAPVVVISEKLWERRFGRNPALLGTTIPVDGVQRTVIGIAPAALGLPRLAEVWVPIFPFAATQPGWQSRGNNPGLYSYGRLKPGVSLQQAAADMERIYVGLRPNYPGNLTGVSARIQTYEENQTDTYRAGLWSLLAATAFVLAIACANVASLFITRGIQQERDYAVRAALGASRAQLIRQMLTESLLVGLTGGVLALLVAGGALQLIRSLIPADNVRFQAIALNFWVLGFSFALAIVSGALAGLWPALKISRTDVRAALHDGGRGATAGGGVRQILVGAQVALTLVLLSVSGLILRSLERMQSADLGFDASSTLTFEISLPGSRYGTDEVRRRDFFLRLVDELKALPGVKTAALSTTPPLDTGWQSSFAVEGVHRLDQNDLPLAEMGMVSDDYFATLKVPLLKGRAFGPPDMTDPSVAIVDEGFARKFWPGQDPLGKRIHWGFSDDESRNWFTVVGIVPTLKVYGYAEPPSRPQAYVSLRQFAWQQKVGLVRTEGNPRLLERQIRELVGRLDPEIAIFNLSTMQEEVASTYQNTTLQSRLLTGFSVLAFVLALTGLYGVVAYGVNTRRREIGVRMALGAASGNVVGLMLRQGLLPLAIGAGIGLAGALAAGRALQTQLFEVSPFDPATLGVATALLALAAALASWLPARRAARVNPVEALRAD